jgi:site-specific DNA recombinase
MEAAAEQFHVYLPVRVSRPAICRRFTTCSCSSGKDRLGKWPGAPPMSPRSGTVGLVCGSIAMVMTTHRQLAGYARVSSERQVQARTIESQRAAIQERIAHDGHSLLPGWLFVDDGYSGDTLERPALEALRDKIAAGEIDRLYLHSPDRLARRYAYQVLLLEEFHRAGVEVVFLNHHPDPSPEGELLLQVQGVIAEYERAKIMERCRRGRRQHARMGDVAVFSRAPFGYAYIEKKSHGVAAFQIHPQQSQTVRLIYRWFVREGMPLARIARRLNQERIPTHSGKALWATNTVWNVLRNPAYMGKARFGRTRVGPRTPRPRPIKRGSEHPRRRLSSHPTSPEEQIEMAVPAIICEEDFTLAQEKLQANRRRCRAGPDGPRHLLQGLLVCRQCGRTLVHHPCGHRGGRRYYYYRCTGLDTHRFGGTRLCQSHAIRSDALEHTVWQDVQALLADPQRLKRAFERRAAGAEDSTPDAVPAEKLVERLEQGLARLIDVYADGLITKEEFEARSTHTRQRTTTLRAELRQTRAEQSARHAAQAACECFETFAEKIRAGIGVEDFATRIKIIRLLVKEISVSNDEITIVYKVYPDPFEGAPAEGLLQHYPRQLGVEVRLRLRRPVPPC